MQFSLIFFPHDTDNVLLLIFTSSSQRSY